MDDSVQSIRLHRVGKDLSEEVDDMVIVEEPLQLSIRYGIKGKRETFSLAITMRTPGEDKALAYGYLFSEHIIRASSDVVQIRRISGRHLLIELAYHVLLSPHLLMRNVLSTSACGACGKTKMEQLELDIPWVLPKAQPQLSSSQLHDWVQTLSDQQRLFSQTGGNHAVALCQKNGEMLIREDVGRHNAMDKVIGQAILEDAIPLKDKIAIVSGRASYELIQKALSAGIPILAAVGAPSSMAVEMAADYNMTLIGFLSAHRFNVYSGIERINADLKVSSD